MNIENTQHNDIYLRQDIKIAIILIIGFVLNTGGIVTLGLKNMGIPGLKYQELWFFILPGAYILFITNYSYQRKFVYIWLFTLFYLTHYLMEHLLYGQYYIPGYQIDLYEKMMTLNFTGMDLLMRWETLYVTFIFLINTRLKYFEFIIKCTVIILTVNTSLIYLDLLGVINIANIKTGFGVFEGRLYSDINLNISCDQNVFGIYCLGFLKIINETNINFNKLNTVSIVISAILIPLLFLQASRGAMILLAVGIGVFMVYSWNKNSYYWKAIALISIGIMSFSNVNIANKLTEEYVVFERI
ncbi:MAG: hypothetical protein K8R79_01430, partial [Calditrichales bacterium]|nr:hypothetical protein [Calditrichales bacterium]